MPGPEMAGEVMKHLFLKFDEAKKKWQRRHRNFMKHSLFWIEVGISPQIKVRHDTMYHVVRYHRQYDYARLSTLSNSWEFMYHDNATGENYLEFYYNWKRKREAKKAAEREALWAARKSKLQGFFNKLKCW